MLIINVFFLFFPNQIYFVMLARDGIFKLLRSTGVDSQESIPPNMGSGSSKQSLPLSFKTPGMKKYNFLR
jgi:hypothetical protein